MSTSKRGKFIVLEGIDGSGKTEQMERLNQNIQKNLDSTVKFHFTYEASNGPIGQVLRNTYLSGKRKIDDRVINMIYAADRYDHIANLEDGIKMQLDHGIHVISDRYVFSSYAYDTYRYTDPAEWETAYQDIYQWNKINTDLCWPDLVIALDCSPKVACQRIMSHRAEQSIYETEAKLTLLAQSYDRVWEKLSDHPEIVRIDGDRNPYVIAQEIFDLVWSVITKGDE